VLLKTLLRKEPCALFPSHSGKTVFEGDVSEYVEQASLIIREAFKSEYDGLEVVFDRSGPCPEDE